MSLRARLAVAMMVAASLPMIVVVGVPVLRAERRARQDAQTRLDLAQRQASFVVERARRDAAARVERAAGELGHDRAAQEFVLGGPEERAHAEARSLAERQGLDDLEILSATGTILASSHADSGAGAGSSLASVPEGAVVVRPAPAGSEARAAFYARRGVLYAREPMSVAGGRDIDRALVGDVLEITGEPTALLDADGHVLDAMGGPAPPGERVAAEISLGEGGWQLRVTVPAGDVRRERRDLLAAFAGIAPFALVSALVIGVLLADRISRPIRALARRADEISTHRAGFTLLEPGRDEVRSLTRSFDRMIESLADSEKQRVAAERIATWQQMARRIAHEVKNPLSPIKLAVENLLRTREKAPAELDHALTLETATILEEVESLRRLVDEFSQFARLPGPQPVPCDPRQIVQQALSLFAPRIEALGVRVDFDPAGAPARVVADPDQIGRAVKNVIANGGLSHFLSTTRCTTTRP